MFELKIGSTVRHADHEDPFIVYMVQTSDIQVFDQEQETLHMINAVSVKGTLTDPEIVCYVGPSSNVVIENEPTEDALELLSEFKTYIEQGGATRVISEEDVLPSLDEDDDGDEDDQHACLHGLIQICFTLLQESDVGLSPSRILRNIADRFDLENAVGPTSIN